MISFGVYRIQGHYWLPLLDRLSPGDFLSVFCDICLNPSNHVQSECQPMSQIWKTVVDHWQNVSISHSRFELSCLLAMAYQLDFCKCFIGVIQLLQWKGIVSAAFSAADYNLFLK